jgi:ATP-binding cassette subfamily F protein 3
MDEPTNHLDIKSKNVLKEALKRYEGTLILVSHDRDFLQGLANKVYEFKDQKIKEYLGDIDYYLEQRKVESLREVEKRTVAKEEPKKRRNQSYEEQKKVKSLKNKLSNVEAKISTLEKEIKAIDLELEINYEEATSQPDFFDKYHQKKSNLDNLMEKWESIQLEIEQFIE